MENTFCERRCTKGAWCCIRKDYGIGVDCCSKSKRDWHHEIPNQTYDEHDEVKRAVINTEIEQCQLFVSSGNHDEILTQLYRLAAEFNNYENMEIINNRREEIGEDWDDSILVRLWSSYVDASPCTVCNMKVFEVLLKSNIPDINKYDKNGLTLLHHICCRNDVKQLKILLQKKIELKLDVNKEKECCGQSCLYDPFPNRLGATPLTICVVNSCFETTEALLKDDVDPNHKGLSKVYPLHHAVISMNKELTKLLLDNNADINCPGKVLSINSGELKRDVLLTPWQLLFMCCRLDPTMNIFFMHNAAMEKYAQEILSMFLKQKDLILEKNASKLSEEELIAHNKMLKKNVPWLHLMMYAIGLPGTKLVENDDEWCLKSLCRKLIRKVVQANNPDRTIFHQLQSLDKLSHVHKRYLFYNVLF